MARHIYCPECGYEISAADIECSECGLPLNSPAESNALIAAGGEFDPKNRDFE